MLTCPSPCGDRAVWLLTSVDDYQQLVCEVHLRDGLIALLTWTWAEVAVSPIDWDAQLGKQREECERIVAEVG